MSMAKVVRGVKQSHAFRHVLNLTQMALPSVESGERCR